MAGENTDDATFERAVDLLQELGLKEYEAKCFSVLSGRPKGTAKEISDRSDVPRTRVYDAIRVLEAKGLVEVQHGSPQQFRAIPVEEAVETLRRQYDSRFDELQTLLNEVETNDEPGDEVHEVWALSGRTAIDNRTESLVADAESEVVLVVGNESVVTSGLVERLNERQADGVAVVLGGVSEAVGNSLKEAVPDAETFVSGLSWLHGPVDDGEFPAEASISRLLLVDRNTILVSTDDGGVERGVFGRGFTNGLVVIMRRLMATGLAPGDDPEMTE
ncbi:TrmB family transcriptional regulator [Halobium salinum]|uniref:TrmB family transcriptional regulator n=1 Tax=Halobium salinum TaxID=1364940 RepID=A0ABD5PBH4_9EURY|nr:helix-turn-helix domain-containing protein [Halobium salinum]